MTDTMTEDLVEKLQSGFEDFGIDIEKNSEPVLKGCAELCSKYGLDPEDFVDSWMAFAASSGIGTLESSHLGPFEKQELSKELEKANKGISIPLNLPSAESKVQVYGRANTEMEIEDITDDIDDPDDLVGTYGGNALLSAYSATPKSENKPAARLRPSVNVGESKNFSPAGFSPAVQAESVSYAARTKAGDAVLRYKCKDSDYWSEVSGNGQPTKVIPKEGTKLLQGPQSTFKYMFQTASSMAAALNAAMVETVYDMVGEDDTDKELQDLRVSSTESCWYFGRIRNDEGRLSQGNTFLEGDLEISGGHTVSLDLSNVEEYRLFPGQVVMVKGNNEMGKCIRVVELLVPPPKPMSQISPKETRPLNVIVACGPYSPVDSLKYEPLKDLIAVIKRDKPDICILIGPFVDPAHPMIAAGEVADTFEDIFGNLMDQVKRSIQDIQTQLVLVPSFRDAHHHQVYPTPPYSLNFVSKTTVVPDPAIFEVAGITFGVTSTDVLKHLANSEISKSTIADRMGGLSKQILSQRNLYPLYPSDESVPLDVPLWRKYCKFTKTPHVLIMPSDLRYFIKDVDGTIVVNPERLTKGKSGGTYARLQVKLTDEIGSDSVSSVADFCCGEIVKI